MPTFEISQVYVIEIFPFLDIIQVQEFQEDYVFDTGRVYVRCNDLNTRPNYTLVKI